MITAVALVLAAYIVARAIPAFRDANRDINEALASIRRDPIDAHFDTAVTEPEFCTTFVELRAGWAKWEQEMTT